MSLSSPEPRPRVDVRPWGRFELLTLNASASVKLLTVNAGQRLSLQRHDLRDEWWTILDEGLYVEVSGLRFGPSVGEKIWVPRGTTHRIGNEGSRPARFLEVSFGEFDGSDIGRLEDDYARVFPEQTQEESQHIEGLTLTVVIPSYNERDNVRPLVDGLNRSLTGVACEILYVDDSTDDTPRVVQELSASSRLPLRVLHRQNASGSLSGAVVEGIRLAKSEYVIVMDGDLQHPAEMVPTLLHSALRNPVDLVVASRYGRFGDMSGLNTTWRRTVSICSTLLARASFPRRVGRATTDPMAGFFCIRRSAVDVNRLHPRGFKILMEILARHDLRVMEVPFAFGRRESGASKASWRKGIAFFHQLVDLRMGRISRFAAVGVCGTFVNLMVMWLFLRAGFHYLPASVAATEISIAHNFVLQERFVFRDLTVGGRPRSVRMLHSLVFNNAEALMRLPFLFLLVTVMGLYALVAQGIMLGLSFSARFLFALRVTYGPRQIKTGPARPGKRARVSA